MYQRMKIKIQYILEVFLEVCPVRDMNDSCYKHKFKDKITKDKNTCYSLSKEQKVF